MISALANWFEAHRQHQLAQNTAWGLLSRGFSLCIQAAYFVIIARSLGAIEYGAFIATTTLAQLVSPFVGFGAANLLVKNVARDRKHFPVYYGNLLFMTIASGLVYLGAVIPAARFVLPASVPLTVIVSVGLAELLFNQIVICSGTAFWAIELIRITAKLDVVAVLSRLIGIALLAAILRHPTVTDWALTYLVTTVFTAILGLVWVHTKMGRPRLAFGRIRREFVEGLCFSTSLSAQSFYNDIDKAMLARMAPLQAVGIYAAAYRLVDVAFIPVRSLLDAAYPGFFRAGSSNIKGAIRYMRTLLPPSAGYALFASLCLFAAAPALPYIFGTDFAESVEALRWLAALPLLKTVHYFISDTLTGAGHQILRTAVQASVAGLNVLLNLWLIPRYSWRGAAWSSILTDASLMALVSLVALVLTVRTTAAVDKHVSKTGKHLTPNSARRNVVVNADDFGVSQQTNQAILRAFREGLISSATIMVNTPGFLDACDIVHRHQLHGKIGLHLNFTHGKPLTAGIAKCPTFCDENGFWRPLRSVHRLSREEELLLEAEITDQFRACKRHGITPTHWDSHHSMHTQHGFAPVIVRMAKRHGAGAVRLANNSASVSATVSLGRRLWTFLSRSLKNTRVRLNGLARVDYFGDARDVASILRTTAADVEVMVHPQLDSAGRLVDLNGEDLASTIAALDVAPEELRSYQQLSASHLDSSR